MCVEMMIIKITFIYSHCFNNKHKFYRAFIVTYLDYLHIYKLSYGYDLLKVTKHWVK